MNRNESLELLAAGLNKYERRLFSRALEAVCDEYVEWTNPFGYTTERCGRT